MLNINYHNDCEDEQEDVLQTSLRNFHVCPLCGQICSQVNGKTFVHSDTTCRSFNENIIYNVEENKIAICPEGKLKIPLNQ